MIFFLLLFLFISSFAQAANSLPSDTITNKTGLGRNSSIAMPVAFYQEETSVGFGLMGGVYFTKNRVDMVSNLQGFVIYTLKNQVKLALLPKIYTPDKRYFFSGHVRATHYPDRYFGIGTNSHSDESFISREVSLLFEAQRLVLGSLRIGAQLGIDKGLVYEMVDGGEIQRLRPAGTDSYTMPTVGALATWDTRDNALFSSRGEFVKISTQLSHSFIGSSLSNARSTIDLRKFYEVAPSNIFASRLFADLTWGDTPFQNLPQLGGNEVLRGYYQGRYRDKMMLSLTAEYRFPIYWRFRGTLFASAGDVAPSMGAFSITTVKYSYGGGIRFRVNPAKMHIRFDVGITQTGRAAVYFSANESF